jgi:hypothetical protein
VHYRYQEKKPVIGSKNMGKKEEKL